MFSEQVETLVIVLQLPLFTNEGNRHMEIKPVSKGSRLVLIHGDSEDWNKRLLIYLLESFSIILYSFKYYSSYYYCLFRATSTSYGGPQARGRIGAVATGLSHSPSDAGSKLPLWPTPQLRQCWILNPLSEARDQTHVLMDTSQICFRWATMGTPVFGIVKNYFRSSRCGTMELVAMSAVGRMQVWPLTQWVKGPGIAATAV